MNIFDTHSDTPYDLFRGKVELYNDTTHVSLGKVEKYERKIFVSAFFSDKTKKDADCWDEFLESSAYYDSLMQKHPDKAMICTNAEDIKKCASEGKFGAIKAIEDVRLIDGHLERLEILYNMGVRHILPVWGSTSHIGGAWDSDEGLTDFGKEVIRECERLGIIVDVSHMSVKSFWDTVQNTKNPIVASHSNYKEISPHGRNLDRDQLALIIERGGIVGLNLCQSHVSMKYAEAPVTQDDDFLGDIAAHVHYCLEHGGEKTLCLGCDWDGTKMSDHIRDVSEIDRLYDRLIKDGVPESTVNDIFFNNAYNFYINNL